MKRRGFTLVELLVVLAIGAIIVGTGMFPMLNSVNNANEYANVERAANEIVYQLKNKIIPQNNISSVENAWDTGGDYVYTDNGFYTLNVNGTNYYLPLGSKNSLIYLTTYRHNITHEVCFKFKLKNKIIPTEKSDYNSWVYSSCNMSAPFFWKKES